jgi:Protein of unknown function (DUF3015)
MRPLYFRHMMLLVGLSVCLGCDATRELVKAPFDATTAVSNGTTQATGELTQPSKEFTSSTTPGSLFRNEKQLRAFIAYNFDNLQRDIAQGRGEYLTSMVTLAEIPPDRQRQLFAELQHRYPLLYPHESSPSQSLETLMTTVGNRPSHVVASQ